MPVERRKEITHLRHRQYCLAKKVLSKAFPGSEICLGSMPGAEDQKGPSSDLE